MNAINPPLLLIVARPEQQALAAQLAARLGQRGLPLTQAPRTPAGVQMVADAALVLLAVTPASLRQPEIVALYREALRLHKTVVPLIVQQPRAMPPDLTSVQWIDCTQGIKVGWQQMVLLLDALGLARWPRATGPIFDAEIVHLRCRTGRVSPRWIVHDFPRSRRYRVTALALVAGATLLAATIGGGILTQFVPVVLVAGAVAIAAAMTYLSQGGNVLNARDPVLVVTPEGWLQSYRGQMTAFAYDQIARLHAERIGTTERFRLSLLLVGQTAPRAIEIIPGFNNGLLASEIIAAYERQRQQEAPPPSPPQIFISYAHADGGFADSLERNLRNVGYATWLDRQVLLGGTRWQTDIRQALDRAAAVVVVLSPAAARSTEVQHEYAYALAQGKRVLVLLAHPTAQIPLALQPHIVGDGSVHPIIGLARTLAALDRNGVAALPGTRFNALLRLGQAVSGELTPGMRLFRGKMPGIFRLAPLLLPVLMVILFAHDAFTSHDFVEDTILSFGAIAVLFLSAVSRRRFRAMPFCIVTHPDGFLYYVSTNLPRIPLYMGFAQTTSLTVHTTSSKTLVTALPLGMQRTIEVPLLRGTFPNHEAIGAQIAADYQRHQQSASTAAYTVGATARAADAPPQ